MCKLLHPGRRWHCQNRERSIEARIKVSVCGALGPGRDSFKEFTNQLRTAVSFYRREESHQRRREDEMEAFIPVIPAG
ncbi:hypothetical protein LEMLEM_LOCUS10335 [Lemmus lemmus]